MEFGQSNQGRKRRIKFFKKFSKKACIFRQGMIVYFGSQKCEQNPGVAKFGIALEWGSRGLEFESRHSDQVRIIRTQSSRLEMCSDFPFLLRIFFEINTVNPVCSQNRLKNSKSKKA